MLKRSIADVSKQKESALQSRQHRELEEAKKELAAKENQLMIMREMVKGRKVQYRQVDQEINRIKNSPARKSPGKGPTPKPAFKMQQADDEDLLSIDDNSDLDPQKFELNEESITGLENYDVQEEQEDDQDLADLGDEDEILREIMAANETPDVQDSLADDIEQLNDSPAAAQDTEEDPVATEPQENENEKEEEKPKTKPVIVRDVKPQGKVDNLVKYLEQTKAAAESGDEAEEVEPVEENKQSTHNFEVSQNDEVQLEDSPDKFENPEDEEA